MSTQGICYKEYIYIILLRDLQLLLIIKNLFQLCVKHKLFLLLEVDFCFKLFI